MGLPEFVCHPSCTFFLEGGVPCCQLPRTLAAQVCFNQPSSSTDVIMVIFTSLFFIQDSSGAASRNTISKTSLQKNSMFSRPFTAVCKDAGLQPLGAAWLDFPRGNRIVVEDGGNTLTQERSRISQISWRVFTEFVPFCEVTNNRNNLHQPPKTQSNSPNAYIFPSPMFEGLHSRDFKS